MQIKTTMRYHLTPVRMPIINKPMKNKSWWWCGENRTLMHCWWGCRLVQPLWKAYGITSKTLKMEVPYGPVILFLGIYLKKPKTPIQKTIQVLEAAHLPISRWLVKMLWHIYTIEYYSAIKKKKILPFVTQWMDVESIILSEISQSYKGKFHIFSPICGI